MADIKKTLSELKADALAKIEEYNDALKKNDFAVMTRAEGELKEVEASYAEAKSVEVFAELKEKENPVREAIATHSYFVIGHKTIKEDGVVKGFELYDDKVRQIDLVKFCKFCKLDTMWANAVERFNQLLTLRAANELKMTKAQIKKICDSYYMSDLARKVEMGETPDSKTAICKQLQQVLDGILFEDNGKGKNVYRVNNHDVAYLLMCYSKRGKKVLTVAVAKSAYVHRLVMDVAHRIVTGKTYDLEYKMVAEKTTDKKAETAKTEPKPKKAKADATTAEPAPEVVEVEKVSA